jgi:hypothetical protein
MESRWQNRWFHSRRQPHASLPGRLPNSFYPPPNCLLDPAEQCSLVAAIRTQLGNAWALALGCVQQQASAVPVLDVREDVPSPPFDLLARVISARPPFSVVLTDWLSMMRADGCGSGPIPILTNSRKVRCTSTPTLLGSDSPRN